LLCEFAVLNKTPIFLLPAGQYPFSDSDSQDELGISWKQEYLVAENPDDSRLVCMVCGGFLATSGPAAAHQHILQQHAHSLDFTLEEKRNILEGWSEGAVLPPAGDSPPPSAGKRLPASHNSVVLHTQVSFSFCVQFTIPFLLRFELPALPVSVSSPQGPGGRKEWLSECGLPSSAPAEIRIFTDGSFPAGFTLKLYCRSQPGPGAKANPRKKTVGKCEPSFLSNVASLFDLRLRFLGRRRDPQWVSLCQRSLLSSGKRFLSLPRKGDFCAVR
uniref:SPIN-DOC-like zinc-finger domain-containing protein n=1 Tax=Pseudonaja textilis TaxID=8673 RepID=A0A670YXN8_PSETE